MCVTKKSAFGIHTPFFSCRKISLSLKFLLPTSIIWYLPHQATLNVRVSNQTHVSTHNSVIQKSGFTSTLFSAQGLSQGVWPSWTLTWRLGSSFKVTPCNYRAGFHMLLLAAKGSSQRLEALLRSLTHGPSTFKFSFGVSPSIKCLSCFESRSPERTLFFLVFAKFWSG